MKLWLLAALALFAAPASASAQAGDTAMDAALRDLCGRQVAMLGEASHGDGETFAFKAVLIRRLVTECGYNVILFESSHYDFLEFMRRLRAREGATPAMLSSAIGGVWNRYAELTPLIRFLFERARAGRLTVGGLDDQLGSAGAFFSLDEMPARLAGLLPAPRREPCREAMRRRIYSSYPRGAPYDEAERTRLRACLREVRAAAGEDAVTVQLVTNFERFLDRDFTDTATLTRERDRSMYLNLRWLAARLGPRAKIVVWAHNAHVANDPTAFPAFAQGGNLGFHVREAYGRRAFALGFSAFAGNWQRPPFMQAPRPISEAAPDSMEARALTGSGADAVYRNARWLGRLGRVPGRPYHYEFAPFDWARAFDGMVVFRAERSPQVAR